MGDISERVQKSIQESPLKNREIADLVGKSEATVYRWGEGKTKNFDANTLKSIASALDVNYEWLRFGRGSKTPSRSNDPKVQYADSVDLPEGGQLSKDHMKQLLGQIESIARILKDSL